MAGFRPVHAIARATRAALVELARSPIVLAFHVLVGAWAVLGLGSLFVGMLGLLAQGLLLLLLGPAGVVVCLTMVHHRAWARPRQVIVALGVGAAVVSACPNRAAPHVFFAVHGAELDEVARELANARGPLWISVPGLFNLDPEKPFNIEPGAVEPLRARLRSAGVLSVGVRDGRIVFSVDGFIDYDRGFVYFAEGPRRPRPGEDFHFGTLCRLVPLSRPGWYFFTTT